MGYGGHLRVLGGDWIGWLRFNALLLRAPLPGLLRFWAGQWDVTCATYRTEGEGWKASEDIVEDMKEEKDMQAYQDGEEEASEEIVAKRTESDDEREAWAKAVAKAVANDPAEEGGTQSRSALSSGVNSSISVVAPAVENVPSAAAAGAGEIPRSVPHRGPAEGERREEAATVNISLAERKPSEV